MAYDIFFCIDASDFSPLQHDKLESQDSWAPPCMQIHLIGVNISYFSTLRTDAPSQWLPGNAAISPGKLGWVAWFG